MALLIVPNLAHMQPKQFDDIDLALWTPQQIASRGVEVTTAAEYTPRWTEEKPAYDPRPIRVASGEAEVQQSERTPVNWSGNVKAATPWTAEFSTAWFPGWEARIDGTPVPTTAARPSGLIRVAVPAGEHQVELAWTRTTTRLVADIVSLASLLALAFAVRRRQASDQQSPQKGEKDAQADELSQ